MPFLRILTFIFICVPFPSIANSKDKPIISGSALFMVNKSIPLMARIDTGATRSSINAKDIKVVGGNKNMKKNIGKQVSFNIVDAKGNKYPISTEILAVHTAKTPQGREQRYLVSLSFTWDDHATKVKVNLRDRSNVEYKLLVGRDWINKNALVDVAPKAIIGGIADYVIADDFPITARVDTGAASTSINATAIKVENGSKEMNNNVGKMISFDITNAKGEIKRLSAPISYVTKISNAIGSEYRYKVAIKIQWQDRIQMLDINLKDRSKLSHKMLIGRDWLATNAIVDSSL